MIRSLLTTLLMCCLMTGAIVLSLSATEVPQVRITVDTQKQLVQVFEDQILVREMRCSTGMPETPTAKGIFHIYQKQPSDEFVEGEAKISYYFLSQFNGHTAFHSMLYGDHPFVEEGEKRFEQGLPSSMGCVRLLLADAQWIYDNIDFGTVVEVF
jgi:lipoprotein-anchoring transpeptidase ErfK/SrfK